MIHNWLVLATPAVFTLFNPRIVVNPIIVHPVDNVDIVVDKAWHFALENHIVAQKHIFVADTSLVVLYNYWKGIVVRISSRASKTKMHLVVETGLAIASLQSNARFSASSKNYQDDSSGLQKFELPHCPPIQWRKESQQGRMGWHTWGERHSRSSHPPRIR